MHVTCCAPSCVYRSDGVVLMPSLPSGRLSSPQQQVTLTKVLCPHVYHGCYIKSRQTRASTAQQRLFAQKQRKCGKQDHGIRRCSLAYWQPQGSPTSPFWSYHHRGGPVFLWRGLICACQRTPPFGEHIPPSACMFGGDVFGPQMCLPAGRPDLWESKKCITCSTRSSSTRDASGNIML